MNNDDDIFLNDTWMFYFHDPNNTEWTYDSYKQVCIISSVKEYWDVYNIINDKVSTGMFFLMREGIFPCWDDAYNINGGCLSLKVFKQDVDRYWNELCMLILGETFLKNEYTHLWNLVNGISISPKKCFSIIKIWLKNDELSDKKLFNFPESYQGDIVYRSNKQNINENYQKNN